MDREVDPAYFEPDMWGKQEGHHPLEECFVHQETGRKISPESYYNLSHDAEVIDRADVTRNDVIRDIVERLDNSWRKISDE